MVDIRTLDIHPAYGYEWQKRWLVAVTLRDDSLKQCGQDPKYASHRLWGQERMGLNNVSKILSYIPLLHIIVGITRIFLNSQDKSSSPEKQAISDRHFTRGCLEIFLGPLLIIVDIVQTIRDYWEVNAFIAKNKEHIINSTKAFYWN